MSWPLVEFGEVATFINGDRGKNYPSKGSFIKEGIPFISAGNLSGEELNPNSFNYISEERYNLLSNGKVKENDILFCLRGSLGKFAVVKGIERGAIASSLVIIRNNEKITLNFLKHYLGSPLCQREINQFENGAAQPNLSAKDLKSFKIPLPPLDEQKRIAAILDKADSVRRKRQQAIGLADDFLRSVFLEMFGDPVSNPKGWEVKALNDISLGKGVYGSGKPAVNFSEGDYRYIRITDITSTGDLKEKKVSLQDSEQESQKYLLEDGDLLFARSGATVGKTFLYSSKYGQCIYAGYLIKFSINRDIALPEFVKAFTDTSIYWNWIKSKQKVVAQPNINAKQYGEELKIPVPPKELQIKFVGVWKKVNESKEKWINSIDGELVQSLSQKAFAGEL